MAVEDGLLTLSVQFKLVLGVLRISWMEIYFSLDSGMRVVFMEEFFERGVKEVIKEALDTVGDGPTYISFDVDGLDPVFAPGTGTPEVGGITTIEAQTLPLRLKGSQSNWCRCGRGCSSF
ncbi:MAG: hypothetical protein Ct9H90mP13_07440 [Pseudomonadota bacterium]|nr:MAG: hypothetical protein Ct9H90mP13_07440 [Pseudomonadota bacterium]